MSSEAQIIANRQNAQKSTGPRTEKGKEITSQNSTKHGLLARQDVIYTESQADFDSYREDLLDELMPVGEIESMLAERIVSLSWRLKRICVIQNQTVDAMNDKITNDPFAKLTPSYLLRKKSDPGAPEQDLSLGKLAIKDFSYARVLDRLLMYERRLEHSLHKTIDGLQKLKLIRKLGSLKESE